MNWYLKVLKQYADFNGRARRKEFWMFTLFSIIISSILSAVGYYLDMLFLERFYSLGLFLPSLAVGTRRLHDINKTGWYSLLWLLPFIGWIWLIVLFCFNGDEGSNEYGPDPKNPSDELEEIGTVEA